MARAEESERITNWAFRQFSLRTIASEKMRVAEAPVFLGEAASVGLIAAENVQVLVPATPGKGVTARVEWQGPLHAPLKAGDRVGELIVSVPDMPELRSPVLVEADVPKAGFLNRLTTAVSVLGGRAASKLVF